MERDPTDGRVKYVNLMQADLDMSIPSWILSSFIPKAYKEWYENLNKYYISINKEQ